jgi:hypothetical protein
MDVRDLGMSLAGTERRTAERRSVVSMPTFTAIELIGIAGRLESIAETVGYVPGLVATPQQLALDAARLREIANSANT